MTQHLLLSVRFHGDGQGTARFHGTSQGAPEWPPAPARVFQALVAGVARGNGLPAAAIPALEWLERLPPPLVASPRRQLGQSINLFVPNNDADSLSDPRNVSGIRTKKAVCPSLFSEDDPILYAWSLPAEPEGTTHSDTIMRISTKLYQLGRGVDMAWAVGEMLDDDALQARLEAYRGVVQRPELGTRGERMLACPVAGSLSSLIQRHGATKLRVDKQGRSERVLFTNPPKPRFVSVCYERSRTRVIFELRQRTQDKPQPWALARVVQLVETLRDAAAARLVGGLVGQGDQVEMALIGRKADGRAPAPIANRSRVIPLPSIGSPYADRAIRRFLLEVPGGSPLRPADIEWAFSGLTGAGAVDAGGAFVTTRTDDDDMFEHYAGPSRCWRSVTAVALPDNAKRRRIEPMRRREEAKGTGERIQEESRAVSAVHAALRHAGVRGLPIAIRVQREPFEGRGARAERFAQGTRFAKERLWHVELTLDRSVEGPLVIGDGRFLGLGVMAPVTEAWSGVRQDQVHDRRPVLVPPSPLGIVALEAPGSSSDEPVALARALRRAVMARVRDTLQTERIPGFFSGHEAGAESENGEGAWHLSFQWDSSRHRFLIIAPHRLARRAPSKAERVHLETLRKALEDLVELRAGAAGRFAIRVRPVEPGDSIVASARRWVSHTPYVVTRHLRCDSAEDALIRDLTAECERRCLPRPQVTILDSRGLSGSGLEGHAQLDFAVSVAGPIVLGRTRYLGGGLFLPHES